MPLQIPFILHEDFFVSADGRAKSYFKIGNSDNQYIIQHPYFPFGQLPYWNKGEDHETEIPIYHEKFELKTNDFDLVDFLSIVEQNWHLKEDELLWCNTGFWSVKSKGTSFMGISIEKLMTVTNDLKSDGYVICLSNNHSVILINAHSDESKILLEIYASNEILPFVEIVDPLRWAVKNFESKLVKKEMRQEWELRRIWRYNKIIAINPVAFIRNADDPTHRLIPVIENKFITRNIAEINRIQYIMGTTSGGFIESDYYSGKKFYIHATIWNFDLATICEFIFNAYKITLF